jgi:carboxylesterase
VFLAEGKSRTKAPTSAMPAIASGASAAAHEALNLIEEVKRGLLEVTCPLRILYSHGDRSIHPRSAQFVYDRVASTDKELVDLQKSGHVITMDTEWEQVAAASHRFIRQRGL